MAEAFFPEVTGPIPFGGLDSTDPLAFKVYEPDRLVLGKRMEDHLRIGRLPLALVRLGRRATCSASGRSIGRGSIRPPTRWPPPAQKMAVAFEFFEKLGMPLLLLPRPRRRARGRVVRRVPRQPRRADRRRARLPGADRARGCCGARPTCSPTRATRAARPPTRIPRSSPTRRRRSSTCSRSPSGSAATNYVLWGGREGYDTLLNTDLKREGDQLARFLHLVVEHKHKIGFKGTLLIEPKPMEPTKHQYDYDVGDGPRLPRRHGLEDEYRLNIEANHATLAGHCFHHEVAYAVAQRHLRLHRRQPRRPAERLGHRPVPELGRGPGPADLRDPARRRASRPAASTSTPSCAARARTATDLFHAHIGGIDTLARALLVAADADRARRRSRSSREERYAGWNGPLGSGDPRRPRDARVARGQGRRPARSTRGRCRAARSCSRTSSTRRIWSGRPRPARSRRGAGR